jgi:glutamate N-acetyltransferase/amino-acid N-acetyltransferase
MTSDTFPKGVSVGLETEGGAFQIGGIAKGAGMINANMATMLCVMTTDAAVPQPALRVALRTAVENFNRITVDGDMSTNDTVILLQRFVQGRAAAGGISGGVDDGRRAARRIVGWRGVLAIGEVEVQGAASAGDAVAPRSHRQLVVGEMRLAGGDPNWANYVCPCITRSKDD